MLTRMNPPAETARVEAEACQRPQRDRRSVFVAPLVIEILAFLSVWLRLYSRWSTVNKFEADDWTMLASMVRLSTRPVHGHLD